VTRAAIVVPRAATCAALVVFGLATVAQAQTATSPATLAGVVRTATGAPVPGARVVARQNAAADPAIADAGGAFRLASVTFPAVLEVSAPGFLTLQTSVRSSPVEIILSPSHIQQSVVVDASGTSAYLPSAASLDRADLEGVPAVAPDEALRTVAGFSLFRRSAARASNPTTHGVTMRGLSASGASRGLVLLDGVPLNDGFGGWVTWTRVPMLALDGIDIDRGAAGDTFGSDALGGVFQLQSGPTHHAVSAGIEAGSNAQTALDVAADHRLGRVSFFGASSWYRTDGVIPLEPESRGAVDARADAEWFNGLAKAAGDTTAGRWIVSGWGGKDDRGNGTVVQRNTMSGGTVAGSFARAAGASLVAVRASLSPNSFDQTFSAVGTGRATETLTSTQAIESRVVRVVGEFSRSVARALVIGRAQMSRASADFIDLRPAGTVDQTLRDDGEAVSVHARLTPGGTVSIGGGVRHEWRAAPANEDDRDQATIGHASVSWQPSSAVTARASMATSHRWPTLNELVRNFQVGAVLTLANPSLQPERSRSADASVTVTGNRWTATGTFFHTRVEDAISNVTIATNRRERRNAGDARAIGVELEAGFRPVDAIRLRASTTVTDATFRDSVEPGLDGNQLPQVPRTAFALTADASLPRSIRASGIWRATSSQFDDDRNAFELAPAYSLDVQLAGRLRHVGWRVILENAFDARVEVGRTPLVTLAPGRSLRAGLTVFLR
jgi:outer membrane cobalamin receptor